MMWKLACSLIIAICTYSNCHGMEGTLLPVSSVQDANQSLTTSWRSCLYRHAASYGVHFVYLSMISALIIASFLYIKSVITPVTEAFDDLKQRVDELESGILLLKNFTQGCPSAMEEWQTATYLSMLNCRDENKCKSLPQFEKPKEKPQNLWLKQIKHP